MPGKAGRSGSGSSSSGRTDGGRRRSHAKAHCSDGGAVAASPSARCSAATCAVKCACSADREGRTAASRVLASSHSPSTSGAHTTPCSHHSHRHSTAHADAKGVSAGQRVGSAQQQQQLSSSSWLLRAARERGAAYGYCDGRTGAACPRWSVTVVTADVRARLLLLHQALRCAREAEERGSVRVRQCVDGHVQRCVQRRQPRGEGLAPVHVPQD